jgi:predicted small lipoprotein YifL
MKNTRFALLLLALALALAGCGNKGPLVHPDAPADAPAQG